MRQTITIDTEQWAVVPRVPTQEMLAAVDERVGGYCFSCTQDRASEDDCQRIYDAMLAAAPRPDAGQQPDPWKPNCIEYDHSIHSNPDAKAWADLFVQTFPGLADKHDLMLGWFANAMMAMHDHMVRRAAPRPVPTSEQERQQYYQQLNQNLRDAGLQTSDPAEPDGGAV